MDRPREGAVLASSLLLPTDPKPDTNQNEGSDKAKLRKEITKPRVAGDLVFDEGDAF